MGSENRPWISAIEDIGNSEGGSQGRLPVSQQMRETVRADAMRAAWNEVTKDHGPDGGAGPIDPANALAKGEPTRGSRQKGASSGPGAVEKERHFTGEKPGTHVIDTDPNSPDGKAGSGALRADINGFQVIDPALKAR